MRTCTFVHMLILMLMLTCAHMLPHANVHVHVHVHMLVLMHVHVRMLMVAHAQSNAHPIILPKKRRLGAVTANFSAASIAATADLRPATQRHNVSC